MCSLNEVEPQDSDGRITYNIVFTDCAKGLGIRVVGGITNKPREPGFGIFIKRILPRDRAAEDGRLQEGDQILSINGESAKHITNERAVTLLRKASASNYINLVISRDELARLEYKELLENHGFLSSANSIADHHSLSSSRASTPSYHHCSLSPGAVDRISLGSSRSHSPGSSHSTESYSRELAREGELSTNGCNVSTASLHESSRLATPPEATHYPEAIITNMSLSPLQYHKSTFTTPHNTANPSASVIMPKVPNSDAAITNALLCQYRGDEYMIPNCASTPQTMVDATHHIGSNSNQSSGNGLSIGANYQPSPVPLVTSSDDRQFSDESAEVSLEGNMAASPSRSPHVNKKLSLDPHVRLRVEKLQVALRYLGLDPDESQKKELYNRLNIDDNDTVEYGEFVRVAREIFKFQLEQKNIGPGTSFLPSSSLSPIYKSQANNHDMNADETPDQVKRERDELKREVERLKNQLRDREATCNTVEDELLRIRREAQGAIEESRALRSKVHLAEQAQHAARCMEQDYEEVVRLLENELAEVRVQASKAVENPAVQKRFAVLSSQLKKAEASKKTYEVATEKLLQFAEHVHSVLTGQEDTLAPRPESKGESGQAGRPPAYLGKHKHPRNLAAEARDVVKSVRSLVEVEPLPFGWDEAYTEDGMRYYINHVTQTTQWTHPVSNVDHKTGSKISPTGAKRTGPTPNYSRHKPGDS